MTRKASPLVDGLGVVGALFTVAGGAVHLREWLDGYKDVPSALDGAFVVKLGFPVNAALSALLAAFIGYVILRPVPMRTFVTAFTAGLVFQVGALLALFISRTDSGLLGWSEPQWTSGATQARFVEAVAIAALAGALALMAIEPKDSEP